MKNTWYIIINPTSGNAAAKKKWKEIVANLNFYEIPYDATFSQYKDHEEILVNNAIQKGYKKFISVGGDGTLHHIVNGIMTQKYVKVSELKIAVIPLGTGNDWVKTYKIPNNIKKAVSIITKENHIKQDIGYLEKTYKIPNNIKKAVSIIAKENHIKQDIGYLELMNKNKSVYFHNLAGLGFDGFVVNNVNKYKKYGFLAYLLGTITSFLHYKKIVFNIRFNDKDISTICLMTLVGICRYSAGGMRLTDNVNPKDGLFDISIAKNISFISMLLNIFKFYNGNIVKHKEVETYKTSEITINTPDNNNFVQADGELIGVGGFKATIIPEAISYIIP